MKHNISAFYGIRFLSNFWLIVPAMVPLYAACGLGATGLLSLQAVFIAVMLVMEIPSGYLADVFGRKKILVLSAFLLPAGVAVYAFSCGIWGFVLAETLIALSFSFRSGADSAMLYDTLLAGRTQEDYKKLEGRGMAIERAGDASGAILGGLAASYMLRLPFYVNIGVACLLVPVAFLIKEPPCENRVKGAHPLLDTARIVKYCVNHPGIFPYIIFSAVMVRFGIISVWGNFLLYKALGIGVAWFGLLHAAFAASSASGAWLSHSIEGRIGERGVILLTLLMVPSFAVIGLAKSLWVVSLILLNGFVMNVAAPVFLNRINTRVESNLRATAISFNNMTGSVIFMVFSPLFGMAVDRLDVNRAFLMLSAALAACAAASLYFIFRTRQGGQQV